MRATHELIFDWNLRVRGARGGRGLVTFDDETLRDGLQSPSVRCPNLDERIGLVHEMVRVGIGFVDVGMPGAGERAAAEAETICRAIASARLPIAPNCAARTIARDVVPVLEIQQRVGLPVEVALFAGSSPIRLHVEGWTIDEVARRCEEAITLAVRSGAPVVFVTEDSTRTRPSHLRRLFLAAARAGATRVCVADTAGHATPVTVVRVVRFVRRLLDGHGLGAVGIDWHGHNDRGLAVANALTAAWAGADRLHGTALGVGERVGNPPMEQLLVNAALEGWAEPDLGAVPGYAKRAADALGITVPVTAPIVGGDAFRTTTGVHAAAIRKAVSLGDETLVDLVYSAVPASWLGRRQVIEVGPMSGASNVRWWLAAHGYPDAPGLVEAILAAAKRAERTLGDDELHALANRGRQA